MTDKELLELAAKAAGMRVNTYAMSWDRARKCFFRDEPDQYGISGPWRPLDDDGDALRLAVHCAMEISTVDDEPGTDGRFTQACVGYATETNPRIYYVFEDHRGDIFAATRRAIVRAAAEIGKAMP